MVRRRTLADRFGIEFDGRAGMVLDAREDGAQRVEVGDAKREMVEADVRAAVEGGRARRIGRDPTATVAGPAQTC